MLKMDTYFVDVDSETSYSILPSGSVDKDNNPEYVLFENTIKKGHLPKAYGTREHIEDVLNELVIQKRTAKEDPEKNLHEAMDYLSKENFRKVVG
jgi:hypothetical protein